jgi:hypothetical protein
MTNAFHTLKICTHLKILAPPDNCPPVLWQLPFPAPGHGSPGIPGSITLPPSDSPEGNHDGNEGIVLKLGCSAFGWAVDPEDRVRDLQVRILSDGSQVATVTADEFREDAEELCVGGTCGFSTSLWGLISRMKTDLAQHDQESASR